MERVPRCGYIRWRLSGDWVSSGANLCGFAEGLGTSGPQPEATLFSYQGQLVAAVELDELCCGCVVPLKVAFIHLKPKACGKGAVRHRRAAQAWRTIQCARGPKRGCLCGCPVSNLSGHLPWAAACSAQKLCGSLCLVLSFASELTPGRCIPLLSLHSNAEPLLPPPRSALLCVWVGHRSSDVLRAGYRGL